MYLNCHSYYSMRFGTFSEIELLELAQKNNVDTVALTDINNTSACLNFIRKAPDYNIKPIVGIDFRNDTHSLYIGLAKNNNGFRELNTFLSSALHQKEKLPHRAPPLTDCFIIYPYEQAITMRLSQLSTNEYIGVSRKDLNKLPFSSLKNMLHKCVILQPVTFRTKKDYNTHRLLRAIDMNVLLSQLPEKEQACFSEKMVPSEEIKQLFSQYTSIIENTRSLQQQCNIKFDFSKNKPSLNKKSYTNDRKKDYILLEQLCREGLIYRYKTLSPSQKIIDRLTKELELINRMNFVSYFLINWKIIKYAREKKYYYVGRGSGANSIVAYLLRITDVDPVELDLYFERFINSHRTSPPDFDIDFSWKDRQDITRYIFDTFGHNHVALLGTYITFQYKGVVRELGRVFGLPKFEIDKLSNQDYEYETLDHISKLVLLYGELIQGKPNYISIHASGILISEAPIHNYSATNLPPKGFSTVQFDMIIAEDIGLYKFDILGQRGLAKIKDALEIIRYNQPDHPPFDIHDVNVFKKDKHINTLIRNAKCLGCFYVESPAMRMLLHKLKTDSYLGLVAASSIIRPGVAKSGMMREYILRKHDTSRTNKAHPILLKLMPETYGIMVYQEDVIKVAHYFGKLSLDEADVLRRGMSGKFRSREEFKIVKQRFISNCRNEGYSEKVIYEVWEQISSFAGYAFPKGHSASYAVESYQSLFLKTYYPLEYLVATINNGGGFYMPEVYIHEIKLLGGIIHTPCINNSNYLAVIKGKDVYLGFMMLRNLETKTSELFLSERSINGEFLSLEDFINRVSISIEQLSILIKIGAFNYTNKTMSELLWVAHLNLNTLTNPHPKTQNSLFTDKPIEYTPPKINRSLLEIAFEQIEALGYPLQGYFPLLKNTPVNKTTTKHLPFYINKNIDIYGFLITTKRTTTSHGHRMIFGTFLDQTGGIFDTVIFPNTLKKYKLKGKGIYRIYGKVVEEFDFLSIEISKVVKQDYIQDPRYT